MLPDLQDAGLLGKKKGKKNTQNKPKVRCSRWQPSFGGNNQKVAISNPGLETVYSLCLCGFSPDLPAQPGTTSEGTPSPFHIAIH